MHSSNLRDISIGVGYFNKWKPDNLDINIKHQKRISFSILLKIKLGPFQKAFSDFCKYFARFEGFLVSKLSVTNVSLNMLVIVISLLQFLFWMKIMTHCNGSKISCLLPKYIRMS